MAVARVVPEDAAVGEGDEGDVEPENGAAEGEE